MPIVLLLECVDIWEWAIRRKKNNSDGGLGRNIGNQTSGTTTDSNVNIS